MASNVNRGKRDASCCINENSHLSSDCTLLITLSQVPKYLRSSALYKILNEAEQEAEEDQNQKRAALRVSADNTDDSFEIPVNKFMRDPDVIESMADAKFLVDTLHFWDCAALPTSLVRYCMANLEQATEILEVAQELSQIKQLKTVIDAPNNKRASVAAASGVLNILQVVCESVCESVCETKGFCSFNEEEVCVAAAKGGNVACLQYVRSLGCRWNSKTCSEAAANGHIECLRYAHEEGCDWDEETCLSAASGGHIACLRYAREHGAEWDETLVCEVAADGGHLECLQYAHQNGDGKWDSRTCAAAAYEGHFACLVYAHENGCEWDEETCLSAASGGHIECLRYAHEHGCEWNASTCKAAAAMGSMECLQYAHENGCEWDSTTCKAAAENGHIECLRYAHGNGCEWDSNTCRAAAENGNIECLQYAHENGCVWDEDTGHAAARNGHIACLQYVCAENCPWVSVCKIKSIAAIMHTLKMCKDARRFANLKVCLKITVDLFAESDTGPEQHILHLPTWGSGIH